MKTYELTGAALDWAVAKCEGREWESADSFIAYHEPGEMNYSTDWGQGGPIIEREKIKLGWMVDRWVAQKDFNYNNCFKDWHHQRPLTAAMRCYVASKLGSTVEVPAELLK